MSDNIFAIMDKTINSISNVNVRNQAIKAAEFARNNNDNKNATELIKLLGLSARNGDIPIFYTGYGPNGVLYGEDGNDEMQGQGGNDLLMGFTARNDAKQTLAAGETDEDRLYGGAGSAYSRARHGVLRPIRLCAVMDKSKTSHAQQHRNNRVV